MNERTKYLKDEKEKQVFESFWGLRPNLNHGRNFRENIFWIRLMVIVLLRIHQRGQTSKNSSCWQNKIFYQNPDEITSAQIVTAI